MGFCQKTVGRDSLLCGVLENAWCFAVGAWLADSNDNGTLVLLVFYTVAFVLCVAVNICRYGKAFLRRVLDGYHDKALTIAGGVSLALITVELLWKSPAFLEIANIICLCGMQCVVVYGLINLYRRCE